MLTIKHIIPTGEEFLYEAIGRVNFVPKDVGHTIDQASRGDIVWFEMLAPTGGSSGPHDLRVGAVYVMNDHGSTVAKYDLGGWSGPSGSETEAPAAA